MRRKEQRLLDKMIKSEQPNPIIKKKQKEKLMKEILSPKKNSEEKQS